MFYNFRHNAYESVALPTELYWHIKKYNTRNHNKQEKNKKILTKVIPSDTMYKNT